MEMNKLSSIRKKKLFFIPVYYYYYYNGWIISSPTFITVRVKKNYSTFGHMSILLNLRPYESILLNFRPYESFYSTFGHMRILIQISDI